MKVDYSLQQTLGRVASAFDTAKIPYSSFDRLIREDFPGGVSAAVLSKEGAIVSKLRWINKGSLRSRKDIKGMLLNSRPIDRSLVLTLAENYGCKELFLEIEAEEPVLEVE